jgi:glutamine amidotransferase
MSIAIIDYKMGNITSVLNSLHFLGLDVTLVSDKSILGEFDTIILPGVGAYSKAMEDLESSGMSKVIVDSAKNGKKIIGICLGMQLLFSKSFEFGECKGLDLIEGEVLPFKGETQLRIPHMGWNSVNAALQDYEEHNGDYYFVHSFYCKPKFEKDILFKTNYGFEFCSAVKKDNIYGFQFHPEKSQKNGLKLLENILKNG